MADELTHYLAAYDSDDQDRTPSDFTVLELRTAALSRVAAENQRLRDEVQRLMAQVPQCDEECAKWGEPQETCSRDGRPVRQVWELLNEQITKGHKLRERLEMLAAEWDGAADAGEDTHPREARTTRLGATELRAAITADDPTPWPHEAKP